MQRVADIFEHDIFMRMIDWSDRVERDGDLTCVSLNKEGRTGHFRGDYGSGRSLAVTARAVSDAAVEHGELRHAQGYSISMLVAESRILHVDECDAQLKQTLASFTRRAAMIAA